MAIKVIHKLLQAIGIYSEKRTDVDSHASIRQSWEAAFKRDMSPVDGFPVVHAAFVKSMHENIQATYMPGSTASDPFINAIDIACGQHDHPFVRDFTAWSIDLANLALADKHRWQTKWAESIHREQYRMFSFLALAKAMQANSDLDRDLVQLSLDHALVMYLENKGNYWDWLSQSEYLEAIQSCLVVRDAKEAEKMLKGGRRFGWTTVWHTWLVQLIRDIAAAEYATLKDVEAIARFDNFFDLIRHQRFVPSKERGHAISVNLSLLRLQLALIRRVWIEGLPIAGAWPQVLSSISK